MVLYYSDSRCQCNKQRVLQERLVITKPIKKNRKKKKGNRQGRILEYDQTIFKRTFKIKYKQKLSLLEKSILKNFQRKYFYYAIDDILYLLKSNTFEQNKLLLMLYSPIISLHNNFSVNFFDIWINNIYIQEITNNNKFLTIDQKQISITYITITLLYKSSLPNKTREFLW